MPARREDRRAGEWEAGDAAILLDEIVHREMDAAKIAPFHGEVARLLRAAGEDEDMIIVHQPIDGDRRPDLDAGAEDHPFRLHLDHAPVDQRLFHLEVGNAVAKQAADAVVLLEHGRRMAHPRELLGAGEAGGAGADDGDPLAAAARAEHRPDPAFAEPAIDDLAFDRLDRHRVVVDVQRARRLARRRAHAAGEFGEIVGPVQPLQRRAPFAPRDQIVPVRDVIVHRAARMAEGHAAIHAALRLKPDLGLGQRLDELGPVLQPLLDRPIGAVVAGDVEESGGVGHAAASSAESARRYSIGITITNWFSARGQLSRIAAARALPVSWRWRSIRPRSHSPSSTGSSAIPAGLQRASNVPAGSQT